MKTCVCCGDVLPIDRFPENRRMPDGHLGWCYDCFKLRTSTRMKKVAPALVPATTPKQPKKRCRFTDEERRIRKRAYQREWCAKNRERRRETNRAYYAAHKEDAEWQEARKTYQAMYRHSDRGRLNRKKAMQRYYAANREKLLAKAKEQYLKKREKALQK